MVRDGGDYLMAVLPAPYHVGLERLRRAAGRPSLRLATEAEFAGLFPECDPGAMPPFGNLYGIPVWVDEDLARDDEIAFNAGNHEETVHMKYADFARLCTRTSPRCARASGQRDGRGERLAALDARRGSRPVALLRSFVLADFVTLANASAGTGAIFSCLLYLDGGRRGVHIAGAFTLLALALACDLADGAIARGRKRSSPFGADLDSLADVVSFGVAPAVIGFTLGLRGLWDVVILCAFVCCGASRLARFNVTLERLSEGTGKVRYYEGTPIPTSLAIVALLALAAWRGAVGDHLWLGTVTLGPGRLHPLVLLYAVSGSAMMSARLRIPKP
jgi:CDP-diacylglycerol--serine O-phosphatidyltransferase